MWNHECIDSIYLFLYFLFVTLFIDLFTIYRTLTNNLVVHCEIGYRCFSILALVLEASSTFGDLLEFRQHLVLQRQPSVVDQFLRHTLTTQTHNIDIRE